MVIRVGEILEVKEKQENKDVPHEKMQHSIEDKKLHEKSFERPDVIDAKVYKLKSRFVKHSIFITIGYVEVDGKRRPYEIFINSKDLSKAAEFTVLTRLISAIFRKTSNPVFILEELKSVHDPNGGYFKDGKYIHSIYAEIADVIERFFEEIGLIKKEHDMSLIKFASPSLMSSITENVNLSEEEMLNLKICPECNMKTLKVENGCFVCINPECNYSKCD